MRRSHLVGFLLLASACLGGCVSLPAEPPDATDGAQQMAGGPVDLNNDHVGVVEARRVVNAPRLDGELDAVWSSAAPARIPLARGREPRGSQDPLEVELRAVHTTDTLYFLAQWLGEPPSGAAQTTFNQLTIHWTIPVTSGSAPPACAVACHTAYVDGRGRLAYMNAETIPQGGQDALPAAGGWAAGKWAVAWSRPLISANAYDLQFDDLGATYLFFVKVFTRASGQSDPVSERHSLVFVPQQ